MQEGPRLEGLSRPTPYSTPSTISTAERRRRNAQRVEEKYAPKDPHGRLEKQQSQVSHQPWIPNKRLPPFPLTFDQLWPDTHCCRIRPEGPQDLVQPS